MTILVSRVKIRNYKSIKSCDISLGELCVLVGLNGSGKSNFLDCFSFVSDALNTTLDTAIRTRGGISAVRRKSGGHPNNFGMSFHIHLPGGRNALFAFEVSALPNEGFEVSREKVTISDPYSLREFHYEVKKGNLLTFSDSDLRPDIRSDRFFITSVAALKPYDLLFDVLSNISIYNINPDDFRIPQPHESGQRLSRTGRNLSSALRYLKDSNEYYFDRVQEYLRKIVSGLQSVAPKSLGPTETIQFTQYIQKMKSPWTFDALNMSNGTLRSLGVLTALFHESRTKGGGVSLVGIEEPEGTVHPGATAVLMDAIIEASKRKQVVITTHSPELLDHEAIKEPDVFVVTSEGNETRISNADSASRKAIRDRLVTPGELMRANQLRASGNTNDDLKQAALFEMMQ